jgi:predicted PolB exonuclease-like 3'-5' exonuclease
MLALDSELKPRKGGCAAGGCAGGEPEKLMIERWSNLASAKPWNQPSPLRLVDWHGRGFDVPVLQTRAFRYGVQLPWYFGRLPDNKGQISTWSKEYRDRYGGWHMDMAELWTNKGGFIRPHMANLARLMGLPGKVGIDGSQVHAAWTEKRFKEIDTYCMQDVFQTAFIFQRFLYLSGKVNLEEYRAAATALLSFVGELEEQKDFHSKIDRAAVLLE